MRTNIFLFALVLVGTFDIVWALAHTSNTLLIIGGVSFSLGVLPLIGIHIYAVLKNGHDPLDVRHLFH